MKKKAGEMLKTNQNRIADLGRQLIIINTKIESVEEKLFTEVINDDTYKRSMKKFNGEQAKLNEELNSLTNFQDHIEQDLLVLPYMVNINQVYEDASISQKHALVREVFKDGFTYKDGMFRTPSINKGLIGNLLAMKQIKLIEVDQLYNNCLAIPYCGE